MATSLARRFQNRAARVLGREQPPGSNPSLAGQHQRQDKCFAAAQRRTSAKSIIEKSIKAHRLC
jgi:hypothetical protein